MLVLGLNGLSIQHGKIPWDAVQYLKGPVEKGRK